MAGEQNPGFIYRRVVAQLVKNPPAMQETWVGSLGREDPRGKGKATHSSTLAWRIPWTAQSWGHKDLDLTERLALHLCSICGSKLKVTQQLVALLGLGVGLRSRESKRILPEL